MSHPRTRIGRALHARRLSAETRLGSTQVGSVALLAAVTWTPNQGRGPGGDAAKAFLNWLSWVGVIAVGVALIICGLLIGFGKLFDHRGASAHGMSGLAWSLFGGALIAGGPQLIKFAMFLGNQA